MGTRIAILRITRSYKCSDTKCNDELAKESCNVFYFLVISINCFIHLTGAYTTVTRLSKQFSFIFILNTCKYNLSMYGRLNSVVCKKCNINKAEFQDILGRHFSAHPYGQQIYLAAYILQGPEKDGKECQQILPFYCYTIRAGPAHCYNYTVW